LFTALQVRATGAIGQTVSLDARQTEIRKILNAIERNGNYRFLYNYELKALKNKVDFSVSNLPVTAALDRLFTGSGLTYKVLGSNLIAVISVKEEENRELRITGKITGAGGQLLGGVSVQEKGTSNGTATDNNGVFSLTVANDAVLVISYIGYETQEVGVNSRSVVDITLVAAQRQMDEVVVIGYGSVRRRDLTGSVVSLKGDVITQAPTHNALEAIQGRAAGVDITRSSGAAGSGVNILIRGYKSIGARNPPQGQADINARNQPLVIIDGFQGGDLSTLNTGDIESMDILKDASATAIYGAQGANGVIIVTTKRGASGKIRVNYNAYYGISTFQYPKPRMGEDYMNLRRQAWKNSIVSGVPEWQSTADDPKLFAGLPGELAAWQAGQWVDWLDLTARDGSQQSHNLSLTAGTDKTKFYMAAGYFREQGMLRHNDYERYNIRINLDQTISKSVKAGITSQVTYNNQNNRVNPLGNATTLAPFGVPYDSAGIVNRLPLQNDNRLSPLTDERNEYIARDNLIRTNVLAGAYLELAPAKGLTIRSNFSTTFNFSRRGVYNDKTSLQQLNNQTSVATQTTGFGRFINWDNIITYSRPMGDHTVTLTGITSYLRSDEEQLIASGTGQISASQIYYGLAGTSTAVTRSISSPFVRWNNMAYAARVNYSYKGRYVLYLSGRYDGASRLGPGHKWDFFPAAGLAWNVSQENFLAKAGWLTDLKLRATYGVSGNYNIDVYGTQSGLTPTSRMSFGEVPAPAYVFNTTVGNPDVGWEKSATINLGLDFGLLNNRISGTIDLFRTETSDILYRRTLPQSTGVADIFENIASTLNKGIEVGITSQNIQRGDFRWTSTLTFTKTDQKVLDIVNGKDIIHSTASERESVLVGRPLLPFYTFIKEGIWQTDEAAKAATIRYGSATGNTFKPGDIKLRDISGPNGVPDGIIDATYDRTYIGSSVPDWIGGLQNTFTYKGFDLGVFLLFRYGQMIDAEFLGRYNPGGNGNGPDIIDYWTPENPTNDFPSPVKNGNIINYAGYQTLTFVDGSFFKIKNITLGYTLPKRISGRIASDNIRFYVTGSNVLTVAKSHLVKDYDPERGGAESNPIGRQFVFGVNVGF
ncbi:MAG: TonB-dependent receptor, partial [Chitinophagaceae bacterium]